MTKMAYCVQKSPPDSRDINYSDIVSAISLPETLDHRTYLPTVRNQGIRGTSLAFAGAAIKEFEERNDNNFDSWMSPEFIHHFQPKDSMCAREMLKTLKNIGIVPDYVFPYRDDENFRPTQNMINMAQRYQINNYARVPTINNLKQALFQEGICLIVFPVYEHRPQFWRSRPGEQYIGGHAVAVVGYNNDGFILRNSWGSRWNETGHVIYPYADWGKHWECWSCVSVIPPTPTCWIKFKHSCAIF